MVKAICVSLRSCDSWYVSDPFIGTLVASRHQPLRKLVANYFIVFTVYSSEGKIMKKYQDINQQNGLIKL